MKVCVQIIGGFWKRSRLLVPSVPGMRPTPARVRETVFNWLGQQLEGRVCLDLFAGSGALGFEAASRSASHVVLVERNPRLVRQLQKNQAKLAASTIEIVQSDAVQFLNACALKRFDIVFIDPPFNSNLIDSVLPLCCARVRLGGRVYVESPKAFDLSDLPILGDWQIDRKSKAGAVHYALLRHKSEQKI